MSDKRAVEDAGPYDVDGRFTVGATLAVARRAAPVSDKRAVEGAGPYDVDGRFPVGAIHESPADADAYLTNGPSRAPAPTQQTHVPP